MPNSCCSLRINMAGACSMTYFVIITGEPLTNSRNSGCNILGKQRECASLNKRGAPVSVSEELLWRATVDMQPESEEAFNGTPTGREKPQECYPAAGTLFMARFIESRTNRPNRTQWRTCNSNPRKFGVLPLAGAHFAPLKRMSDRSRPTEKASSSQQQWLHPGAAPTTPFGTRALQGYPSILRVML